MQVPEISLYVAIINQALKDALGLSGDPHYNFQTKAQAQAWFNRDNEDLITICDIMDIEPLSLIKLYKKFQVKKKLYSERFIISRTY